jgi:DNA-binding response OmpR family regulator
MDGRVHIAVLEDRCALREALIVSLAAEGRCLHGLDSGGALDRLLASQHIDIALIDGQLPDGDGETIARRLRQQRPSIRLVLLSARSPGLQRRGGGWPFDATCDKPAGLHRLDRLVADLAQGCRQVDPRGRAGAQPPTAGPARQS